MPPQASRELIDFVLSSVTSLSFYYNSLSFSLLFDAYPSILILFIFVFVPLIVTVFKYFFGTWEGDGAL